VLEFGSSQLDGVSQCCKQADLILLDCCGDGGAGCGVIPTPQRLNGSFGCGQSLSL